MFLVLLIRVAKNLYNMYNSLKFNPDHSSLILTFQAGRWVAELVARLSATAALWVRNQTPLKKNERHEQRSGQHTLARQKKDI